MTIQYANDLVLTDFERQIANEHKSMKCYLLAGDLDGAFLRARTLQVKLDKLMARLNEIKYCTQKAPECTQKANDGA